MRVCAIMVGSFFLLVCVVMGQNPYATVTGRVVDPANATIVGAKVEIVNSETGVKYSVETNSEGIYTCKNRGPAKSICSSSSLGSGRKCDELTSNSRRPDRDRAMPRHARTLLSSHSGFEAVL